MKSLTLSQRLLVLSGIFFAGFLGCQLSYKVIGSHIDRQGVLREPFFLIPSSVLLLLASSASLAAAGISEAKHRM